MAHTLRAEKIRVTAWLVGIVVLSMGLVTLHGRNVTLGWDRNSEPDIAGYVLYYGTTTRTYSSSTNVGNNTNVTVNLAEGITYFFAVTAFNKAEQESDFSAEASYLVPSNLNQSPTISSIPNQFVNKNTATSPISFTISDPETPAANLGLTATSSNLALVPNANLTFGGAGTNRTITASPVTNATGTTLITLTVSDGQLTAHQAFLLTVTGSNNPPILSVPSQIAAAKTTPTPIPNITIMDSDAGSGNLLLLLSAQRGILTLAANIPSGVTSSQILGNGSTNLSVTATLAALNATLSAPSGLIYTGQPNLVGTDALFVSINDNGNTGLGGAKTAFQNISIQVSGDTLDTWHNRYFTEHDLTDTNKEATVWGDLADPDLDGRNNLMEFALGLDPLTRETSITGIDSGSVAINGSTYLSLTFKQRKSEPLLQYLPQVSSDKQNWSTNLTQLQLLNISTYDSEFNLVTYRDSVAIIADHARFIRLKVIRN
jgi:hypothetical protein